MVNELNRNNKLYTYGLLLVSLIICSHNNDSYYIATAATVNNLPLPYKHYTCQNLRNLRNLLELYQNVVILYTQHGFISTEYIIPYVSPANHPRIHPIQLLCRKKFNLPHPNDGIVNFWYFDFTKWLVFDLRTK